MRVSFTRGCVKEWNLYTFYELMKVYVKKLISFLFVEISHIAS